MVVGFSYQEGGGFWCFCLDDRVCSFLEHGLELVLLNVFLHPRRRHPVVSFSLSRSLSLVSSRLVSSRLFRSLALNSNTAWRAPLFLLLSSLLSSSLDVFVFQTAKT